MAANGGVLPDDVALTLVLFPSLLLSDRHKGKRRTVLRDVPVPLVKKAFDNSLFLPLQHAGAMRCIVALLPDFLSHEQSSQMTPHLPLSSREGSGWWLDEELCTPS